MYWPKTKNQNIKIDWILIGEIAGICVILIPIFILSFYAIPGGDEFANTNKIKTSMAEGYSHTGASLYMTIHYYKNVSGYFFGAFLNFFVSPFLRGGINALRVTVFVINLFFYISLYGFVASLLKIFFEIDNRKIKLLSYFLVLFAITNHYNNSETWTWFCVLIGYVFLIGCMFWGIICFIKAIKSGKKSYVIGASVIGFLVSGDSLNLTALNCGIYFLIGIWAVFVYKKKKTAIICFGSALLSGIINLIAPGNFIRHDLVTNEYPIGGALKTAAFLTWSRFQYLFFYTPFIILLIVFFIIAFKFFYCHYDLKGYQLVIALGIIFLGVTIVNFPVCLGYNSGTMPDRCIWVEDCTIYIGMFGWTACLAGWLKRKTGNMKIQKETLICIAISCMLFLCSLGSVRSFDDYPTVEMVKQLTNGEISEYFKFWNDVFEEIETSPDKGVAVLREEIPENQFVFPLHLRDDKTWWVNKAVALYYNKDWVYISTKGEIEE